MVNLAKFAVLAEDFLVHPPCQDVHHVHIDPVSFRPAPSKEYLKNGFWQTYMVRGGLKTL